MSTFISPAGTPVKKKGAGPSSSYKHAGTQAACTGKREREQKELHSSQDEPNMPDVNSLVKQKRRISSAEGHVSKNSSDTEHMHISYPHEDKLHSFPTLGQPVTDTD